MVSFGRKVERGVGHAQLVALVHVRCAPVQVRCRCSTVASVLAEATRWGVLSSSNRDTERGWSWISDVPRKW